MMVPHNCPAQMVLPGRTIRSYTIQCSSAGHGLVILINVTERVSSITVPQAGWAYRNHWSQQQPVWNPAYKLTLCHVEEMLFILSVKP